MIGFLGWPLRWLDKLFTTGIGADWSVVAVMPTPGPDRTYITLAEGLTWNMALDYAQVLNEHPSPRAMGHPVEAVRTAEVIDNNSRISRRLSFETWKQEP